MSPKQIFYLAFACLLLIFTTQAYLVNDYFQTTRAGLIRESDAILEEAFKKDLEVRRKLFKNSENENLNLAEPNASINKTTTYDFSKRSDYINNIIGLLDLAINMHISDRIPININHLDSITSSVLNSRRINTSYSINIVDPKTGKIFQSSNQDKITHSLFQISSKYLTIDIIHNKALQLILVNPFGLIIKRMGLMLLSSLILSIICLFAFRFLLRVLAKQKQLVAFKNDFLSTIAHELKRPVASLTFNLDCLTLPAFIDDRQKHELLVHRSINATAELNDTINMIVALEKLQEGLLVLNKEPINLKRLFEGLKEKFVNYPAKKVEIQTVYEETEISVAGDQNLLNQCFANLIDNAIKYSDNEVLIVITLHKEGNWIIVSIKDNGFGIPVEKLPVIFDKYSRAHTDIAKINGFGIGLNYVKTIVEKHKGEVEVKSLVGTGSEFKVLLPE
ncbi:MAG: HAMP domain-containing sensor histidine kinase [Paludibacter sp.]|nr:HAMP domain-containing sensor histidine kinase [Paludibacter sp.]